MSMTETQSYSGDDRLEQALAEYEMALGAGTPLDRESFLERYADVAGELEALLYAAEQVEALAEPLRQALQGKSPAPFPTPAGYEILDEVGIGGMGVVYRARQIGTNQLVALKMLRSDWLESLDPESRQKAVRQFALEAEAAASLRHPNRVRIFHWGEYEGFPYYVMELIEGENLAERVRRPGSVRKSQGVRYLADIADAVHDAHEAHEHGYLHRDIKPHNILIDARTDEALLTDFGLALAGANTTADGRTDEASVRCHARLAGTLPYMSPEATWDSDRLTPASDVYALGATLYEVLTGVPPFQGQSRADLTDKIRRESPVPPSRLNREVPTRVERICLKCLEKDPERRYGTARELGEELRRYLSVIRYAANFTTMGSLIMALGPVFLLINLGVYLLLGRLAEHPSWEPITWLALFSLYPPLFAVFLLSPAQTDGRREDTLSWPEQWCIWGGKMFTAITISIALRVTHRDPVQAILLVYPVFAGLSGMAVFVMTGKMPKKLHFIAAGCWLVALLMAIDLPRAPIYYGVYAVIGCLVFGYFLRRLGKELS